jgi:hypothetical protein
MSDACAEQEPPLRGMVDWDTEVMRLKGNKTRRTKGKTIYCHENAEVIPPEDPPVKPASRNTKASPKQRNPITPDEKPPMKTRCSGACVHASQTGSQLDSCHIRVYFYDDEWFPRKSLSVLQSIKATYPGNITFEKIKTPRPGSRRSDKPKHGFASDNEPTFEVIPNSDIRALRAMLQKLTQRIDEDSRSLKPGAIYGFSRPDAPGYIKIGTTGPDNAEKRVRTIGQSCGFTPKLLFSAEMPCAAGIIESLIHLQLHENRRRNIFCTQKCTTQHDEWFDISETEAIKQVARWLAFSHSMPYVGNILKRFWKDMVEEVRAVLRDDSTPEKWVALMIDAIPLEKEEENRIRVTEVRFAIRIRAEGECSSLQVIQQGGFGDKVLTTVPLLMDT